MMNGLEQSDLAIVPMRAANKGTLVPAEPTEGRAGTKGNPRGQSTHRTQRRARVSQAAERIRQAATRKPKEKLTALLHQGKCPDETRHRQVKYLNNVVEADHGKLKLLLGPVRGFKTLKTAYATLKGFEVMRALRKGQARAFALQGGIIGEARIGERVQIDPDNLRECAEKNALSRKSRIQARARYHGTGGSNADRAVRWRWDRPSRVRSTQRPLTGQYDRRPHRPGGRNRTDNRGSDERIIGYFRNFPLGKLQPMHKTFPKHFSWLRNWRHSGIRLS